MGTLLIVSAPSGAGKTTLIRELLEREPNLTFSISHTTRPMRLGEVDGKDYYFVSDQEFDRMIREEEFAEWAFIHNHRYGTTIKEIKRLFAEGKDIVFDVDYHGNRALKRSFPEAISVLILPPTMQELKRRIMNRCSEDENSLKIRLKNARIDIALGSEYQFIVVNDRLEDAVDDLRAILRAGRLRAIFASSLLKRLVSEVI